MSILVLETSTKTWTIYYDETKRDFLVWRLASGLTVEIYDIHCETRREGRGRTMLNALYRLIPKSVKTVWAITRASNFIAQEFYEGMNFRVVGVLRAFYRDEPGADKIVDAIMYGKDVG